VGIYAAFGGGVRMSALLIKAMDDRLDRMLSAVVEVPPVSPGVSIPGTFESVMRKLEDTGYTVIRSPTASGLLHLRGRVICTDERYATYEPYEEICLSFDPSKTQINLYILWPAKPGSSAERFHVWNNTGITSDTLNAHGGSTNETPMSTIDFSKIAGLQNIEIESIEQGGGSIILKLNTRKEHAPMPGRPINMKTHPFALVIRYTLTFQR
jgi:hypothetical protein